MSANLVLDGLIIDEGRAPDFAAARKAIDCLKPEDVEEPEEFDPFDPDQTSGLREIRQRLHADLGSLEAEIEDPIELAELQIRGATVYLTGGMSYGDRPTDVCGVIARLLAVTGVLSAAGFDG